MRPRFQVVISESTSIPHAEVPCNFVWELVEYLSYQRVSVIYSFRETFFLISFPRTSPRVAQEILDDWVQTRLESKELKEAALS